MKIEISKIDSDHKTHYKSMLLDENEQHILQCVLDQSADCKANEIGERFTKLKNSF